MCVTTYHRTSEGGRFDVNASTPAFDSASQTAGVSLEAGARQTQTATRFPFSWRYSTSSGVTSSGEAGRSMPSTSLLTTARAAAQASSRLRGSATCRHGCVLSRRLSSSTCVGIVASGGRIVEIRRCPRRVPRAAERTRSMLVKTAARAPRPGRAVARRSCSRRLRT